MTQTRIAIPTDDGHTISKHFGQARYFDVVTLQENQVAFQETREKASHRHGEHPNEPGVHPGQMMIDAISDCQVLISGGMGAPVYARAAQAGIQVFLTHKTSIDDALQAYLLGTLDNDPRLVHQHT